MKSKITSKFQVTIPREIRTVPRLNISDSIEWEIEDSNIRGRSITTDFSLIRFLSCGPNPSESLETPSSPRPQKFLELPVYTFDRAFRRQLERVSIRIDTQWGTLPSGSNEPE